MSSANPYAPPVADTGVVAVPPAQLRTVQRIYWWSGVIGSVGWCVCGVLFVGVYGPFPIGRGEPDLALAAVVFSMSMLHTCLCNYCRVTANRLAINPGRYRRRSRLVGFAMAVMYFPYLTVPGLYCVWKIDRHFAESSRTDADQVSEDSK
jgi:hypothetical protein